jgi:hypothetical protein
MKLILDGITAVGPNRGALLNWLRTNPRFDANGDTTSRVYGLYTVSGKALRFVGPITAA